MGSADGGGNSGQTGAGGWAGHMAGSVRISGAGSAGLRGGSAAQPHSAEAANASANIRNLVSEVLVDTGPEDC
ncbi:MAG: hypothetical protein SF172_10310 [Burkholderiales bacterium]|nr:hypothetical protein [Burkholderiales bacterium]